MKTTLVHITVDPRERVVVHRDGQFLAVLEPGRYRRVRRGRYVVVPVAERLTQLAPQEVPCADGILVKVTAVVRHQVVDAVRFVERAADAEALVYLAAQVALRDALATLPSDEIARGVRQHPDLVLAATRAADALAQTVGVTVHELVVKDVILPTELRAAALELATAKTRGAARLETARAETAALRSLANGAKLLEDHPALARQRLVESAPFGSKLVIRFDDADD